MEELLTRIKEETVNFMDDAAKAVAGNKAAGQRSRKTSNVINRLFKEWRQVSLQKREAE